MQTIRITITSEKPTNVVFTEKKPESKKKKSPHKKFEELLNLMPKQTVHAMASEGDEQSCD